MSLWPGQRFILIFLGAEMWQDIVYCPRCDLEGDGQRIPCIQDDDHMARCEVCGFVFCGRCRAVPLARFCGLANSEDARIPV